MTNTLRDKLIQKGWVTPFNADTLVRLIEEHYAATVLETTVISFDKGIKAAAAMIRVSAIRSKFLDLLKLNPQAVLNDLATAIEDTTNNNSNSLPEVNND